MPHALKNMLLFLPLLLATGAFAQQGRIRGRLADTVGHEILKGALITVTSTSDTNFTKKSVSREDASFEVYPLPYGNYSLRISFQGFQPVSRMVQLNQEHPLMDVGMIYLRIKVSELDTIRVEEPAIMLKKDTLLYNASRWQTQPYAPVADLLAELPGIKLNSDGSLTVNGLPVDRILVDGKPFFNGDPKMALQHLPADIIKQIQVYQTTDQRSSFLSLPSNTSANKTVNLVLKINRRKGEFGKVGAGAGPDGVYAAVLDLHHMNGKQQLSIVGDAGNAGSLNTGKAGEGIGMNQAEAFGITRQWNGGINYRDSWRENMDINGNYMNSGQHIEDNRKEHTLNLFPGDSSVILTRQVNSITENSKHRLNVTVENKWNASNLLTVRSNLEMQRTERQSSGQSQQSSGKPEALIYSSTNNNTSTSDTKTGAADLLYLHRGNVTSRSFSAGLGIYGHHNKSNSFNATQTVFADAAITSGNFNRHAVNTQSLFNVSPSLTYTIPIGKKDILDLQGHYHYSTSRSRNEVFRYNEISHQFELRDSLQSNDFNAIYNTARALMNYKLQRKAYTMVIGAGIESDHLQGKNFSNDSTITKHFTGFLPAADLTVRWKNSKSIQFGYRGKPVTLSVMQLQPVTTTADSLFIQEGNPQLKQPFTHSFTLTYSSMPMVSQRFFTLVISGSTTVNAIQHSITLLSNGAQVLKPINMSRLTSIYANAYYRLPLPKQRGDIGLTGNINYSHQPGMSNGQKIHTNMLNLSGTVSWSYNTGKGWSFDINAVTAYNKVQYAQDTDQNNDYFTETIGAKVLYAIRDWSFTLTEFYSWNNSLVTGYQPEAPVLSLTLSRRFLKGKEAELKLSVADLLNQQSGAIRTVTLNAITDMTARTRGRYAMLSFIYNISRFRTGK